MKKLVEIKNLSLAIEDRIILKDISIDIEAGKSTVIIGESGSGKTTLARLIMGFSPSGSKLSGEINFNGEDILACKKKVLKTMRGVCMAFIPQNPMALFSPMQKIKEDFIETFKSHKRISRKECLDLAIKKMTELKLKNPSEILEKYPFELSGGMLQRIMIAMILGLEPAILVADEPSSALDYANSLELISILNGLKKRSISLLVVTHDYIILKKLADRIIIMKDGSVVEDLKVHNSKIETRTQYGKDLLKRAVGLRPKVKNGRDN